MLAPNVDEAYRDLLRTARRVARSAEEARDLVQDVLVIALAGGFEDWPSPERRAWLRGIVRKRAAFVARGHGRRRRREAAPERAADGQARWVWQPRFLASLPRSLRAVATLASADLCAAEIRWLLGLSDTALRKRLSSLRSAVRAESEPPTRPAPEAPPALGARRASYWPACGARAVRCSRRTTQMATRPRRRRHRHRRRGTGRTGRTGADARHRSTRRLVRRVQGPRWAHARLLSGRGAATQAIGAGAPAHHAAGLSPYRP
jgi:DNA-directed RNA polymerase specialized sigma24 family protein